MTVKGRLDVRRGRTIGGMSGSFGGAVRLGRLLVHFMRRVIGVGPGRVLDELLSRGAKAAERWRVVIVARLVVRRLLPAPKANMLEREQQVSETVSRPSTGSGKYLNGSQIGFQFTH